MAMGHGRGECEAVEWASTPPGKDGGPSVRYGGWVTWMAFQYIK